MTDEANESLTPSDSTLLTRSDLMNVPFARTKHTYHTRSAKSVDGFPSSLISLDRVSAACIDQQTTAAR